MFLLLLVISIIIAAISLDQKIKKSRLKTRLKKIEVKRSRASGANDLYFTSLSKHYSYCFILWSIIAAIAIAISPLSLSLKYAAIFLFIIINFFIFFKFSDNNFNAKGHIEKSGQYILALTAGVGILITIIITASIFFESLKFFQKVSFFDFIFGLQWNPQIAIHEDQAVENSSFGFVPVFLGTLLITLIAMIVAIPLGIMGAIYLSIYSKDSFRDNVKPILEILAGVPTVVYGYFAISTIGPLFKNIFDFIGIEIAGESALAAGFVMGIMIIPFILSLTDDALRSVPGALKDGALAMGSTKSEMIKRVALPAATPNIVGAIILAISRAIGETMIVVMAAGLIAKLTINPLDSVTTTTAQIVTLLVGDQEFDSPKTLAAFALALALFILTFCFNIVALSVIKNYKKKYG